MPFLENVGFGDIPSLKGYHLQSTLVLVKFQGKPFAEYADFHKFQRTPLAEYADCERRLKLRGTPFVAYVDFSEIPFFVE